MIAVFKIVKNPSLTSPGWRSPTVSITPSSRRKLSTRVVASFRRSTIHGTKSPLKYITRSGSNDGVVVVVARVALVDVAGVVVAAVVAAAVAVAVAVAVVVAIP